MTVRSFPDSGVLIDAARGESGFGLAALQYLNDPSRTLLTSPMVRLEVMPKATFTRRAGELAFYGAFFQNRRVEWCRDWDRMERIAIEEACQLGLGAADALHLAAALLLGADELVTTERPTKPIFRSRLVRVSYLYASQT